jgi:hypothetical protein
LRDAMTELQRLETELEQVRASISAAYTSHEYEIESGQSRRRLKRQSLDALLRREAQLVTSIGRLTGDGARGIRHGVPEK